MLAILNSLNAYNSPILTDFVDGILGQVWYLIVSILDIYTLTYFDDTCIKIHGS